MDTNTPAPAVAETVPAPAPALAIDQPKFPEGTKLREYETIYALKPDLTDEAVDKFKERVRALIARDGGKVVKFTVWGKKKTQFEIRKQSRAIYTHVHFLGPAPVVAELERNFRNDENLIRFQTIKLADESDANRPVEQDVKLAGDADQPDRPPREERSDRRDDFGDAGERDMGGDDDGESA
jgi:small subunit ribosomal protein S6